MQKQKQIQIKATNKLVNKPLKSNINLKSINKGLKQINYLNKIINKELDKNNTNWQLVLNSNKAIKQIKLNINSKPYFKIDNSIQLKNLKIGV